MNRLVYSPSVQAWIKTDTGVVDLSSYIVHCSVHRKMDDISTAEIEFRNPRITVDGKPRFMFTEHNVNGQILPVFHPMDPITIVLERMAGKPIQVFTGYCDSVPDVQLFPGTAKIKASCTLKRLLHTYWDPALPFVQKFLQHYGWNLDPATGQVGTPLSEQESELISSTNNLNDSSIGNLLYAVLNEIGGWDPSNIYIQPLPPNILSIVGNLFSEFIKDNASSNDEVAKLMSDIIGSGNDAYGTAAVGGNGAGNPNYSGGQANVQNFTGTGAAGNNRLLPTQRRFRDKLAQLSGLNKGVITAWILAEMGGKESPAAISRDNSHNHNWLNIGWTNQGRIGLTYDQVWGTPEKAAQATDDFLKGKRFGPSDGIRRIISTAGKSPATQIQAIKDSGWAQPTYTTLEGLYNQYGR